MPGRIISLPHKTEIRKSSRKGAEENEVQKTLNHVVEIIQIRIRIYVNEDWGKSSGHCLNRCA
jgi:hypothetical protein